MPLLTVVNLTTSVIPIQDPTGISTFTQKVPASGTLGPVAVSLDQLAHLEPQLKAEATASRITWSVADDPASQADSPPQHISRVLTTPYNALPGDQLILTKLTSPAAVSVVLPAAAPIGSVVEVFDETGDASTRNITITAAGGGTIQGAGSAVISTDKGSVKLFKTTATKWLLETLPTGLSVGTGALAANAVTEAKLALTIAGVTQLLSGAGAVDVTHRTTRLTSTGAGQAITLADGTSIGQRKSIVHDVDGGSMVLTPATPFHFATITFTAVHDFAELEWTASGWIVVGYGGVTIA